MNTKTPYLILNSKMKKTILPLDKAAILAKRGEVIKNPVEYKENNW